VQGGEEDALSERKEARHLTGEGGEEREIRLEITNPRRIGVNEWLKKAKPCPGINASHLAGETLSRKRKRWNSMVRKGANRIVKRTPQLRIESSGWLRSRQGRRLEPRADYEDGIKRGNHRRLHGVYEGNL